MDWGSGGLGNYFDDWMAVRAALMAISSAVQPRERSLTGFSRPCKSGPTAMLCPNREANL